MSRPDEDDGEDALTPVMQGLKEDALKQLEAALQGDLRPLAPAVFIPPGVRALLADNRVARDAIAHHLNETFKPPTVQDDVVRIQRDLDPIGMAIAIAQGMAIPVYVPQDKGIVVKYVQVSTRERLKLLNRLMDRVLPAESPRKPGKPEDPQGVLNPNTFLDMVRQAADLANQRRIELQPRNITPSPDPSYREADFVEQTTNHPPKDGG